MPDEASPTAAPNAGLDDLERRLASFEHATRRLGRTVGGMAEPGHASPPRPATRRLSESGTPRGEEISGLRPAVQQPVTGALTARARNPGAATPGFTSAYGKPAIPAAAQVNHTDYTPPTAGSPSTRPWRLRLWAIGAGGAVAAMAIVGLSLPTAFPRCPEGGIDARSIMVDAPAEGVLTALPRALGSPVSKGDEVARIQLTGSDTILSVPSPTDGLVSRFHSAEGRQIAGGAELVEIAQPGTAYAWAVVPSGARVAMGDRVEIELVGDARVVQGTISEMLEIGAAGPGPRDGRRRLVAQLDPSPASPRLGQGIRLTVIGPSPGPLRLLLLRLRGMLP